MKRLTILALVLASVASIAPSAAGQQGAGTVTCVPVSGPVYLLAGPGGNVGVIADPGGVVLIDTMEAAEAGDLRAAILTVPGGAPVRMIINTHWHPDHTGGNAAFAAGAVVIAQENVVPLLSRDVTAAGQVARALPPEARPSKTYKDSLELRVGGEALRLVHYPRAHTDGDTVVFLDRLGVVHMGDMFFNGMFPFLDVENGGDIRSWVRQLDTILATLPADVKIIPGHGALAGKAELVAFREMLADSTTLVQERIDRGETLEQIKAAGLPGRFDAWTKGFLTAARWLELVYRSLAAPEALAPGPPQSIVDAVKTGTPDQVRALVAKDSALVNLRDSDGRTPLHHAAIVGSVPMIECLLSLGAAIDATSPEGLTPLLEAVRIGKDAGAVTLIDKGAKIEGALHSAARFNRPAVIERLIAHGADIEARDQAGYTALTAATRIGGPFDAVDLLVRKGANFNLPDSLGNTPLDNAVIYYKGDNRTIDLLLARSAAVNPQPEELATTLSIAVHHGQLRLLEYYLARGGQALLAADSTRRTIMRSATTGGSLEMVKALQARGIALELAADWTGATPLHSLASNPRALDLIRFLVANGADVNARTNDGRSAYNIAAAAGSHRAAALLLELGARADPQQFPRLAGPYLGQTPPGDDLAPFAPGIVYVEHGTVSASPTGQELYWPSGNGIMTSRTEDGRWTKPAFAPFSAASEVMFHDDVPFVTPDNKRLFFTSKRAVAPGAPQKENIWFVERTPAGWSDPRPVGPAVNAMSLHWQVSVSSAGTLCFGGGREKDGYGSSDIYCSRLVNGEYTEPVNLGPAVNTKDSEMQPFIAPDESFILFFRAPGQIPSAYVSFKGPDGRWLPAVTLDLPWAGAGLIVSPDGKYLFTAGLWKSAGFLENLKRGEAGR